MASTYVNWRILMVLALEARGRASAAVAANPDVATGDALAVIVLSAGAAEAFINEIGAVLATDDVAPAALATMAREILRIEDEHGSVEEKYLAASDALGSRFDKGAAPWQDFAVVLRLRDAVLHMKPKAQEDAAGRPLVANLILPLEQKGLTYPVRDGVHADWALRIMTDRVAAWAYDGVLNLLRSFIALAPEHDSVETLFSWPMHNL